MKLPLSMLRDYVDIPVTPKEYEDRMIMTGTAVEGLEDLGSEIDLVVVGRVLTCEDVEGTHLHQCTVDVGGAEPLHIVCGAPNVAVGILVPVALDGAKLPGGVKIKKGKLRGMVSEGMLCAATELKVPNELYPNVGDAGLLVFHEDMPGVIMRVSSILALERINIAFMKVFRSEKSKGACMVIETDSRVDEATRRRIELNVDGITEVCTL